MKQLFCNSVETLLHFFLDKGRKTNLVREMLNCMTFLSRLFRPIKSLYIWSFYCTLETTEVAIKIPGGFFPSPPLPSHRKCHKGGTFEMHLNIPQTFIAQSSAEQKEAALSIMHLEKY